MELGPLVQHWGEGWRWLVYGALIVLVPGSSLFLFGLWLMKMTPRKWWRAVWGGSDGE